MRRFGMINLHLVADQWGNACSYIQSNYAGMSECILGMHCVLIRFRGQVSVQEVLCEATIGVNFDSPFAQPCRKGAGLPFRTEVQASSSRKDTQTACR